MIRLAEARVRTLGEVGCDLKFIETDFRDTVPLNNSIASSHIFFSTCLIHRLS